MGVINSLAVLTLSGDQVKKKKRASRVGFAREDEEPADEEGAPMVVVASSAVLPAIAETEENRDDSEIL